MQDLDVLIPLSHQTPCIIVFPQTLAELVMVAFTDVFTALHLLMNIRKSALIVVCATWLVGVCAHRRCLISEQLMRILCELVQTPLGQWR
jgi:hypothetical protein